MRILIGYESSGVVREAFRSQGHEAWSCDLQPADDKSPFHFQCDIWDVATKPGWDMGLFHPMCTYLTNSAAWAFTDGPYHMKLKLGTLVGEARREARREAIENFRRILALPYPKAIENPTGAISTAIRKPDQIIQPYQFGDDASKGTCLWLDRLPPLLGTKYISPRFVCAECNTPLPKHYSGDDYCQTCQQEATRMLPRWGNQTDGGQNKLTPSDTRWKERSRTYPGIANAMATQWPST